MSYKLGQEQGIKWATKLLLGKLSAGLELSTDSVDVTNDTSAGFKEHLPSDLGGTVSFSAVYDPAATVGQGCEDLKADWLSKSIKALTFGGLVTGDKITSANAFITKFSQSAKHGDKITCDVTFQLTGAITNTTSA